MTIITRMTISRSRKPFLAGTAAVQVCSLDAYSASDLLEL